MLFLVRKFVLISLLSLSMITPGVASKRYIWGTMSGNKISSRINHSLNPNKTSEFQQLKNNLSYKIKGIDSTALDIGLKAYMCANHARQLATKYLTIIDYNKPSSKERMYIIDMEKQKLISSQLVAHGQNSGGLNTRKFSNIDGSRQTSLGVFMTGNIYHGKNGLSMRLKGLEQGYNDKASKRAIVMHGANYVSQSYVKRYGMIGRSWGCPAIDSRAASKTINTLKEGSVLVAYYNDKNWLKKSNYLHCNAVI